MKYFILTVLKILNKRERRKLGKLVALDVLIGLLDILFLGFLLLLINFYTKSTAPGADFISNLFSDRNSLLLIGIFLALFSVKNWIAYKITAAQYVFFYNVASRLSEQNIWHYLKDDYLKFIEIDSSVRIRKISQQPIEFSNYILTNIQQVLSQTILITFTIVGILFYHPVLFFLLFGLLLVPVLLLGHFIKNKLRYTRAKTKTTSEKTLQHLQESLSGFIESNIYNKNSFFINRYLEYQQQLNSNIATQQSLQSLPSRLIEVFAVFGFFILIVLHQWFTHTPFVDLLTIGVFMAAAYKIIPGIVKILNSTGQIKTYRFILSDLIPPENVENVESIEKTNNIENVENMQSFTKAASIHSIRLERIGFHYNQQQIFKDFNFEMKSGDFIGISGKSGLGKTTLINLILGFLDPQNGHVLINGQSSTCADLQQYWPKISYVKQQPFLIHDSVLMNVTLTDGDYNVAKLAEVFCFSGIDQMLSQYPEGIKKTITENGKNISGGQRQRIALARALYSDFDVLILDEPFGEMDEAAEREILLQLVLLAKQGKMILMITHNTASLSFCTKVISLHGE